MNPIHRLRRALYAPLSVGPPREPLPKLFFLHVPKCGGTSVDAAFRRAYERRGHPVAQLDIGASVRAAKAVDFVPYSYHNVLLSYFLADARNRYVTGHFMFERTTWAAFGEEWKAVTLLRDPESRWFSHYFYNRYKDTEQFRILKPLSDFIETPRARRMGAIYVEHFANPEDRSEAARPETIARAVEVLSRFDVVGVLERLDVFARDVEGVCGFYPEFEHRRKNPRDEGQRREEVTDVVRARVRELCAPSRQVYEAVRAALDRRGSWREVHPGDLAPGGPPVPSPT